VIGAFIRLCAKTGAHPLALQFPCPRTFRHQFFRAGFLWASLMLFIPVMVLVAAPSRNCAADSTDNDIIYLKNLSLEDLLSTEVTTVSRHSEKLSDAAAAVFVITNEEIRRSGATSLPEALRMVPGLQVAKINTGSWVVTSRGFAGLHANKLLVLIDGRTVYTPLFSGVFWDTQDALLADIERIEIIRGPGASLWGANAVNGIINIITKHAVDTQGGYLAAGAGTEENYFGGGRYGFKIGEDTYMRLYAKAFERDQGASAGLHPPHDHWQGGRGGLRLDWQLSRDSDLTVEGEFFKSDLGLTRSVISYTHAPIYGELVDTRNKTAGGYLLGRWSKVFSADSDMALQVYYVQSSMEDLLLEEDRQTADIDFQHRFRLGARQNVVWGLGYRVTWDEMVSSPYLQVTDPTKDLHLFSAFVQDRITVIPEKFWLTLGSKFEHNDLTEWEIQPTIRMTYKPFESQTLWASVSRAVRTPSRGEAGFQTDWSIVPPGTAENPMQVPLLTQIEANPDVAAEDLIAYEAGFRWTARDIFFMDLAVFYHDYRDILGDEEGMPHPAYDPVPHLVLPLQVANNDEAVGYGAELAITYCPADFWQFKGAYTYLELDFENSYTLAGASPRHQFSLRSLTDLGESLELDLWLRYVDELSRLDVDSYWNFDARLGWKLTPNWTLSLVGQNLLEESHLEYNPFTFPTVPTQVERGVYAMLEWKF